MIRIDARELYQVLELTPPEQNILLVGKHGIGKSEIISHFYRQRQKLPVIPFFLGQMSDPGDLIGLLHKDEKTGRSVFLPPYWWPDRRAWVKVADFVRNHKQLEEIHFKLIAGMVGTRASLAFRQSLATQRGLGPEQLLLQYSKHSKQLKDMEIQDFASLNERVLLWLNSGHCPEKKADNARKNLLKYLQYLQKAKQQEAIAHFSSLVQVPKFSDAMGFIAESMDLIDFLSEYLEAIEV
ncbi:hypothetical protein MC7420_1589 [Coleofasciculus chthonoplastes PCC 7420]|uniref:Uncharacterized protein n=1 Tax=Coleofasciculus chthonoplastes PCC 7420 TaxID=118168 RepID=B4W316_9CYAN|nr:hypothetical protein [Coleofasciculus chthonoplastes]EDX71375.1 hypothetical protein MC7420_1589 [Coleofasciculus chthonoplastes PCC 7420]